MLENLIETLPDRRAPLLRQQLKSLSESSKRSFWMWMISTLLKKVIYRAWVVAARMLISRSQPSQ